MNRLPKPTYRRFLERTFIGRALARVITLIVVCQMLVANQACLLAADRVTKSKSTKSTGKARPGAVRQ